MAGFQMSTEDHKLSELRLADKGDQPHGVDGGHGSLPATKFLRRMRHTFSLD